MNCLIKQMLLSGFFSIFATTTTLPQQISVDEWGHMTTNGVLTLPGVLMPDPTGGLLGWPVMVYTLPFAGVQGDVLVQDPFEPGSPILDVLRFDGNSYLIFYSDSIDGYEEPADTPGPPDPFYPNYVFVNEQILGHIDWADYTPGPNQPGWDPSNPSYHFVSDGLVPEPGVGTLALVGLGILAWRSRWQKGISRLGHS